MTIVNNMAIAIEGFIADICWDYLHNKDHLKHLLTGDIDRMTWHAKKKLYNSLFAKQIEDYNGFDGISALINFRNNLAHGRTYTEFATRDVAGTILSNLAHFSIEINKGTAVHNFWIC